MAITDKEIMHIAKLSLLEIDEKHFSKLASDMNAIVEMADKLRELKADESVSAFCVEDIYNAFKDDTVSPSFDREDILKNAPDQKGGCFFVPKIVE